MDAILAVEEILNKEGVYAVLRFLNSRTPHRFTGIYRYDGDILRNVYLFDQFDPSVVRGQDVDMVHAYCANVARHGSGIEFSNIKTDKALKVKSESPVISYCGALMKDSNGQPYGTLCNYDLNPCDPTGDLPFLEEVAPLVYLALVREGFPEHAGPVNDNS